MKEKNKEVSSFRYLVEENERIYFFVDVPHHNRDTLVPFMRLLVMIWL